jgi:hypothetical protein
MTLGSAAAAGVRLNRMVLGLPPPGRTRIPASTATRYGPETTVLDWKARLVCTECGSRSTWW